MRDGDAFISLMPSTRMCISCGIDHTAEARVIGKQWVSWSPSDAEELHYRWEVAPSRAYFTSPQVRTLQIQTLQAFLMPGIRWVEARKLIPMPSCLIKFQEASFTVIDAVLQARDVEWSSWDLTAKRLLLRACKVVKHRTG